MDLSSLAHESSTRSGVQGDMTTMQALIPDQYIALCLSGGGLRATLFHLGVIKALRAHLVGGEMALLRVKEIYSVSGGSIVAAHFLKNHDRYTGQDKQFAEVEGELLDFARSNVRDRVLRRWGLTWPVRSRGHWLQKEYERLLGTMTISSCYNKLNTFNTDLTLHILATNFNTGELCSFSGKWFEKVRRTDGGHATDLAPAGQIRLAYAVAASSSFPPMFPPIALTPELLGKPESDEFKMSIDLSDGGVYDNFGVDKYRLVQRTGPKPDVLVVSHAGGSFDTAPNRTYASMLSRNIRASDIMMRRVGDSTLKSAAASGGPKYVLVRIGAALDDKTLEVATQQQLRLVRTDLDSFGRDPLRPAGRSRIPCRLPGLRGRGWAAGTRPVIKPAGDREPHLESVVREAAHRSAWPLFFDLRDWAPLLAWWLLAACVLAAAAFAGNAVYEGKQAELELSRTRERTLEQQSRLINDFARQLERVREATATENLAAIKRVLGVAIETTEQHAADPGATVTRGATSISADQAKRIVEERPNVPRLSDTTYQQRVFIQFAGVLTRAQITALNSALKQAGWRAEGASGERIAAAANLNEVRYSGPNRAAAGDLAVAINNAGLGLPRPVVPRENPSIRPDVLEAWISR